MSALAPETRTRTSGTRRTLAGVTVGALIAGALTATVAAPASAAVTGDVTGGTLTWEISGQFRDHLSTRVATDGASVSDTGVWAFSGGTGTVNLVTGASSVQYEGSASGSFVNGGTTYYTVTITDPQVVVAADGSGEIIADVATMVNLGGVSTSSTDDVVVTRFDASESGWTAGDDAAELTATPAWADVIAPGSQDATDVGLTDGLKPYEGKSFSKEFLLALPSSLRPHFYKSSTADTQEKKAPSSFDATAVAAAPSLDAEVVSATPEGGLEIAVSGDGFRGVTNAGDAGVYVGVAPAGEMPDVSSQSGAASFGGTIWLNPGALATGSFEKTLTVPTDFIEAGTDYAVYTWQAHTYSNTSQNTQTPIEFDPADLGLLLDSSVEIAIGSATVTAGSKVALSATVSEGATGKVEWWDGEKKLGSTTAIEGVARYNVAASVGAHTYRAEYLGNATFAGSVSSSIDVTVKKATTKVTIAGAAFKKKTTPKVTVWLGTVPGLGYTTGKVKLYASGVYVKTITFTAADKGKRTVTLSKAYTTGPTVQAKFLGTANISSGNSAKVKLSVK